MPHSLSALSAPVRRPIFRGAVHLEQERGAVLRLVALGIILSATVTILVGVLRPPALRAQAEESYCRPPLKFAAGSCVAQCPAGYEDRGRVCSFRSLSR